MKALGVKVIWSLKLKDDQKDIKLPEDKNFYIKPWQPQLEVLAHPKVEAGITHCGFGGTNDFLITGTVPILFPHFEDQHYNANMLAKAEIGPTLCNVERQTADIVKMYSYTDKMFDAKHVTKIADDALKEPKYRKNLARMRMQSEVSRGREAVVQTIERHYIAGSDHLTDRDLLEKTGGLSWCMSCWSILILLGIFAALVVFTVMYFVDDE